MDTASKGDEEFLLGQQVDLSRKLEKFPKNEGYKILLKCHHEEIEHLELVFYYQSKPLFRVE